MSKEKETKVKENDKGTKKEEFSSYVTLGVMITVFLALATFMYVMTSVPDMPSYSKEISTPLIIKQTDSRIEKFNDKEAFTIFDEREVKIATNTSDEHVFNYEEIFTLKENADIFKQVNKEKVYGTENIVRAALESALVLSLLLIVFYFVVKRDSAGKDTRLGHLVLVIFMILIPLSAVQGIRIIQPVQLLSYEEVVEMQVKGELSPTVLSLEYDATEDVFLYNNIKIKASALPDSIEKVDQEVIYKDGSLYKK